MNANAKVYELRSAWALATLILVCFLLYPSVSDAEGIPCSDLGFDPETEGGGILLRYFVAADGIGGLGCWMHPHPNGKDAIFTPFSWGQTPNPGKQGLIDDAMTAIDETTVFLRRLGTVDSELYMLLTDLVREEWTAAAHTIENGRCWMEITAAAGWGIHGEMRRDYKSTVAHEISHCFFNENFERYNFQGTEFDAWWDESGSDFMMAQIYPEVNSEHASSLEFDMDGAEFMQEYNAVALLQHWSNLNGIESTYDFLRTMWLNGRTRSRFIAYLETSDLDEFFHDFNVYHYLQTVADPGGGNMPAESEISSYTHKRLDGPSGTIEVGKIQPRRLVLVALEMPAGTRVTLRAPEGVNETFHATVHFQGKNLSDWTDGISFRGNCDSAVRLPLLLTTLESNGLGHHTFSYLVESDPNCICGETQLADACLIGHWEMEPDSRGMMFGDEDGAVSGRVALTFTKTGIFQYIFTNLTHHGISYTHTGRFKTAVIKGYSGNVLGCASVAPEGRRTMGPNKDNAIPMQTTVVHDDVSRHLNIRHASRGTTTNKTEPGLENWHWPYKPAYVLCQGNSLRIDQRHYSRVGN